jgi:hypothetical protein
VKQDKKYIIDDINVSECEFIGNIKNDFIMCTSWVHNNKKQVSGHWDCRENKNCYFKQLKRLEEKTEKYKNLTYEELKKMTDGKIHEIEQESEKIISFYKKILSDCDKVLDMRYMEE